MLLAIGTRIRGVHGLGTIIQYNGQQDLPQYVRDNPAALHEAASLGLITTSSFYTADRYPYVIQFDQATMSELVATGRHIGFTEVYGAESFTIVSAT